MPEPTAPASSLAADAGAFAYASGRRATRFYGRRTLVGVALTAPALVAVAATMLYPIGWTIWLSVNSSKTALRGTPDFVGLDNYVKIGANPDFLTALTQTAGIVAASFILEAVLGLTVALALHRALAGTRFFRAIVALPLMVAPVVGALAWRFMFADGYGMIDAIAQHFGGEGPLWFANVWLARATIVIANLWLALPFVILVLLAGLAALPTEPLEAARVDGASPWQILTRVTLPLLRPVIAIILVIRLADAFRIFDVVYVLTGSGPANRTDVLSTFIYRQMFTVFDFSGGAAASVLLVVITSVASLAAVLALRERRGTLIAMGAGPSRSFGGDIAAWLVLLVTAVMVLIPIFWIFSTSFKPTPEILVTPTTLLPRQPTLEHYGVALSGDFRSYLTNSLIAAGGATILGLLLSVPAAYGFAKYRYGGSGTLLAFIVVTRVFPPIALALPFFLQFRTLGLIDTPFGLIIAYLPIVLPLMIWMLHGFFRDFPTELIEAAELDGLGVLKTLVRIVLPLSLPALGVATLFGFLVAWNEFVIALTITRTPAGQTMPVGISTLITQFQVLWGDMMAVAAIYLLPVFVVTVITQRGLVRGLMTGATKG